MERIADGVRGSCESKSGEDMMANMEEANKRMEEEADQVSPDTQKLIVGVTQYSPDKEANTVPMEEVESCQEDPVEGADGSSKFRGHSKADRARGRLPQRAAWAASCPPSSPGQS